MKMFFYVQNLSKNLVVRIARVLARETGKEEKAAIQHLFKRLSISLARGNAALILSRKPSSLPPDLTGDRTDRPTD